MENNKFSEENSKEEELVSSVPNESDEIKADPLFRVKEYMKRRGILKFFLQSLNEDQWQTALD